MSPQQLEQFSSEAVQMRYHRLMAEFVGEEVSRLSVSVFRTTVDTLYGYALELDRARWLDDMDRQNLANMKAHYLTMMSGISQYGALRLCHMLEQLPDLSSRRGLLEQLRERFSPN